MPSSHASEGSERAVDEQTAAAQARIDEAVDEGANGGQARAELAAMEDRYKRALADLDNYRKRSARETDRRVAESREALLAEWLEALDSVERALGMETNPDAVAGLRAVLEQMEAILARHGVRRFGAPGERFDPELHEAIAVRANDDVPDRAILEVARSGFALGDRVLRPAQVIVAQGAPDDGR
jgi:molecular chaperone GrpE